MRASAFGRLLKQSLQPVQRLHRLAGAHAVGVHDPQRLFRRAGTAGRRGLRHRGEQRQGVEVGGTGGVAFQALQHVTGPGDHGRGHPPLLVDKRPGQEGCAWCYGFMIAIGLRVEAWQPLLDNPEMRTLIGMIAVLAEADELSEVATKLPQDSPEIVQEP